MLVSCLYLKTECLCHLLLREVEVELDEAAKRGGRSDAAAAVVASGSAAAEAEPAAPTEGA